MSKNACEKGKPPKLGKKHKFGCSKCGRTAKKKRKLCKPSKLRARST